MARGKTKQQLIAEKEELRSRLQELEDTLEAIRSGAVDAIVAAGPEGDRVYTLEGADRAYLRMVESMSEGAVTLMTDGTILYANRQFGRMTGAPPSEIVGRRFHDFVSAQDQSVTNKILRGEGAGFKMEIHLVRDAVDEIPVQLSPSPIELDGAEALTLVVTDLSERKKLEDIVAAERLSRRILEQAQEGIAICIDGHIVRANNSLYRICGNIQLMQPFDDIFAFESSSSEQFTVVIPQSGKSIRNEEVRYRRPDGMCFDLLLSAGPLFGSRGEVLGCLISLTDVTEIKQAEREIAKLNRELQQKIQNLEAVFETAPIGLAITEDPEGMRIRGNPANERILGVPRGAELSKHPPEPARYRVLQDGRELAVEELPMQRAVRGENVSNLVVDLVREDGRTVKLFSNASPLLDEQGRPRGAVGAFLDITELARAQDALRKSEERYRVLLNTAPDAIVVHRDGQILFANDAALRLYGAADLGQLQSRNIVDLLHPDDRNLTRERIRKVQSGERTESREARLLRLDGCEVPVEATAGPVEFGGKRAVQVILRDITARKHVEDLLKADLSALMSMHSLSGRILGAEGFQPLLQEVMDAAVSVMGARRGTLQLIEGDTLQIVAHHGHEPPFLEFFVSAESRDSACGEALLRGERVVIPDVEESPLFAGTPSLPVFRGASVRAIQSTPMVGRTGRTVGILTTHWEVPHRPGEHAFWRIDLLARQAADLIEQVQAKEALQRSEARFRLLSETAARLLAAEEPQGLIESLCRQVMGHLDCQAFFNFMVDERAGRLRLNACAGIPEEEARKLEWLDYGVAVCGCVARDGVRIIAEDIFHTLDTRTELVKSYGIQAYCCHPMKAQDRLLGTLSFGTKTRARFTEEEVDVMRTVADQVAVALQRIEAKRELSESRQRLQTALDAGGMGTWSWDLRSHHVLWNPRQYELLGLPAGGGVEDIETFYQLVHPEDLPGLREAVMDAVARAGLLQQEFRVVRPDGKVRWMTTLGQVLRDDAGQPLSMNGVVYDFTERRRREEELGKLNRMLRALSNGSLAQARAEEETAYLEEVCKIVVRDCGYAMVWIGYAENNEDKTVRPLAYAGFEDGYLGTLKLTWADRERGRGPTGTAIREAKPVICADMLTDPRFSLWRDEALKRGYASSLALPLMSEGKAFGAVTIYSGEPNPFTQEEVLLLTELADDLTRGITMLRLKRSNREAREALQRSKDKLEERVRDRTAEISLLLGEVEKSRDALRRLASELVMAEEQERKRIAVTLHDEVAQTLAAAKMRLDMLKNVERAGDYDRVVREIRDLLAQSIRETRSLMTDISSPVLYDMGLASAVQAMADQVSADSGIAVSYLFRGEVKDLGTELGVMIYHVVKELLQNIVKHSEARSASIRIAREDNIVRTIVADDGQGFDGGIGSPGQQGGFGLFSIRERVRSFEGDLHIESRPGKGTVVTVTMPVHAGDRDREAAPAKEGAPRKGRKTRTP